jgi:hypothetical protein
MGREIVVVKAGRRLRVIGALSAMVGTVVAFASPLAGGILLFGGIGVFVAGRLRE